MDVASLQMLEKGKWCDFGEAIFFIVEFLERVTWSTLDYKVVKTCFDAFFDVAGVKFGSRVGRLECNLATTVTIDNFWGY